MATKKAGKAAAGKAKAKQQQPAHARSSSSFPMLVPTELYLRANARADELCLVPTRFFQRCVDKLIALDIPPSVAEAVLRVRKSKSPHGEAIPRTPWNFELAVEKRDAGHAAARALGFTMTTYLIACIEQLAATPEPHYLTAPDAYLAERRQQAIEQARGVLAQRRTAQRTKDKAA